jgi:hypothetical protein
MVYDTHSREESPMTTRTYALFLGVLQLLGVRRLS